MSSSQIVELAKKVYVRDKVFFDSLIEFENTKRMNTKVHMDFTIDRNKASKFSRLCKEKGLNMSRQIENQIDLIIKNNS